MPTAEKLLNAIERRRVSLAAERGYMEPVSYSEAGREIGVHSSMFSRLKMGVMPNQKSVNAILEWIGEDYCESCPEGGDFAEEVEGEPGTELEAVAEETTAEAEKRVINAIFATGRFSDSDDEDTQKAVARARELLNEGAVGVSVALDLHPDDAETMADAEKKQADDGWENPIEDYLPDGFVPRQRIRHTAIVDTPAFADARLRELEDGSLQGWIVFEGVYTGDLRTVALNSIELDAGNLPHPIIWDRNEGDHSGMTIGYITTLERQEDVGETSGRTVLNDEAITASLAPLELPARYFAQTVPTKAEPMRISKPDANGYRSIRGLAAPNGVCIRQSMKCWTWPGDKDKSHRHFHTGTLLRLDDGSDIRVGALTMGGAHLDGALAKQGVSAKDVSNYRDNANRVFALVRVWESRFGLMMAGVIPPDVTDADVTRALACSPSIEFWPEQGGRTLVGLHLVPTPALPVLASAGSAEHFVTDFEIELEEDGPADDIDDSAAADLADSELAVEVVKIAERLESLVERIEKLDASIKTLVALTPIEDVHIPDA